MSSRPTSSDASAGPIPSGPTDDHRSDTTDAFLASRVGPEVVGFDDSVVDDPRPSRRSTGGDAGVVEADPPATPTTDSSTEGKST